MLRSLMEHTHADLFLLHAGEQAFGTLYIGVTNNLIRRVFEHKQDIIEGFTKKYKVHSLVYYEHTSDIYSAIEREKAIKRWKRQWKINLIRQKNPDWDDLYLELV